MVQVHSFSTVIMDSLAEVRRKLVKKKINK